MLRRLGQFLTKVKTDPQIKRGLALIQAVNLFKKKLKSLGLTEDDIKHLKFKYQRGEFIVVTSNNLIAQEIKLNVSQFQDDINKKLNSNLITNIRVRKGG